MHTVHSYSGNDGNHVQADASLGGQNILNE